MVLPLRIHSRLTGALLLCAGVLGGCATSAPDAYTAREFNFDALLAELQPAPRASGSVITASDIAALPANFTVEEVIAQTAGAYLRRDHRPGGEMTVYILGSANPLFVLDGVPYESEGAVPVNTRDIERIELLKYGAGVALYGFRGSNGVILITTKKGR